MELPGSFTSFWSVSVRFGSFTKLVVPGDTQCYVTNACVSQEPPRPDSGTLTLYLRVNQIPEVAVVPFVMNTFESTNLDLRFSPGDTLRFRITGLEHPVHICGYLVGCFEIERTEEDF
jgi:hypothetical protein